MINAIICRAAGAIMDRKGVTAAEYAVLAVGIVIVVATAAATLGNGISGLFNNIASTVNK